MLYGRGYCSYKRCIYINICRWLIMYVCGGGSYTKSVLPYIYSTPSRPSTQVKQGLRRPVPLKPDVHRQGGQGEGVSMS